MATAGSERDARDAHGVTALRSEKMLETLSWRVRRGGGTCTAEVNHSITGYPMQQKSRFNTFGIAAPEGSVPTVIWIRFDGDVYWVKLSALQGWPRTIRVTQNDVDGVR